MLLKKLCPLRRGNAIVVNSVATGLGSLIVQWAKHLKAVVIGIVDSEDDVERAKQNGCNEVVVNGAEGGYIGFADEVRELTSGEGVAAVFDLVGKSTFVDALHCLAPKGMSVSLGATAGNAPVLNFKDLGGRGSLVVAVPVLADYVKHPAVLLEGTQFLFELHKAGVIKVEITEKAENLPLGVEDPIKLSHAETTGRAVIRAENMAILALQCVKANHVWT